MPSSILTFFPDAIEHNAVTWKLYLSRKINKPYRLDDFYVSGSGAAFSDALTRYVKIVNCTKYFVSINLPNFPWKKSLAQFVGVAYIKKNIITF